MNREEWFSAPDYPATIPALLGRAAALHGNRDFIVAGDSHISFVDAERASARLGEELLRRGVGKGTRVGILMPNTPDWVVAFLAITRIGAVAILISTLYQRRDLGWILQHSDIDTLLMVDRYLSHDYIARLEEIVPDLAGQTPDKPLATKYLPYLRYVYIWGQVSVWAKSVSQLSADEAAALVPAVEGLVTPADLCLVIYTSGSTAEPKGVVHAHGPIVRRPHIVRGQKMFKPDDRVLQLGPFCWVGGVLSILWAMEYGLCVLCPPDTKTESIVATIKRHMPTRIQAQPGKIKQLRSHPELAGDPRFAFLDGEHDEHGALIPAGRFSRGLGMTETVAMHSVELCGKIPTNKPGAFGRGVFDIERRIRDGVAGNWVGPNVEGDLWVRGPGVLQGLYKRERFEVFDPDGFYPTGDRCSIDEDGFLYYFGRGGEMIKTAGANVSPREVEQLLESYPAVAEAGIFALPGEGFDQIVAGVVVPKIGETLDAEDLRAKLRRDISSFKVPKVLYVEAHEAVPRTRSGKLDKRAYAKAIASTAGTNSKTQLAR